MFVLLLADRDNYRRLMRAGVSNSLVHPALPFGNERYIRSGHNRPGFAAESHAGDVEYLIAYVGVRHKVADHYKYLKHCLRRQLGRRYECL